MLEPVLAQFYIEMQQWIDGDTPEDNKYGFMADHGLCSNFANYNRIKTGVDSSRSISQHFRDCGLSAAYPFYSISIVGRESYMYDAEIEANTLYQNHVRLAWVAKWAAIASLQLN